MKTKSVTFLLSLTFLFLFSCSEQKPKPKIESIENPKVRESFNNFVMPIIKSLEVEKLKEWGFGPNYDRVNEKFENEFEVSLRPQTKQTKTQINLGYMKGSIKLQGSTKHLAKSYRENIFLYFVKLSKNEPWKLITYGGYIMDEGAYLSPDVHVYIKSKFETIPFMEYRRERREGNLL